MVATVDKVIVRHKAALKTIYNHTYDIFAYEVVVGDRVIKTFPNLYPAECFAKGYEAALLVAGRLASEQGENKEYDRALAEMLCDLMGEPMDRKWEMLALARHLVESSEGDDAL
jgi:hypothetical protein